MFYWRPKCHLSMECRSHPLGLLNIPIPILSCLFSADLFYEGLCLVQCNIKENCPHCMTKPSPFRSMGLFHLTTYGELNDIRGANRTNKLTTLHYKCGNNNFCGGCFPWSCWANVCWYLAVSFLCLRPGVNQYPCGGSCICWPRNCWTDAIWSSRCRMLSGCVLGLLHRLNNLIWNASALKISRAISDISLQPSAGPSILGAPSSSLVRLCLGLALSVP